jgi:hypothetical protein
MALTSDEQRKCFLHLGVLQVNRTGVFVGGVPETQEASHILQVSLDHVTANGETTVREHLTLLDAMRSELYTARDRFKASSVGKIILSEREERRREALYQREVQALAATLDVSNILTNCCTWREP